MAMTGPPTVTADLWPHPLTEEGRAVRDLGVRPGETLADLVGRILPGPHAPHVVAAAVDGRPLPADGWAGVHLRGGEIVTLRRVCQGGGGGGSDVRQTLLTLAVVVAAYYGAPHLATAIGVSESAAFTSIMIGGGLIVQAVASPNRPAFDPVREPPEARGRGYSSASSANRVRPHQPMLLVLGSHRVYPDRVTDVETFRDETSGDLVVRQLLSWGVGDLDIGSLQIGTSALSAYRSTHVTTWLPGASPYGATDRIVHVEEIGLDIELTHAVSRTARRGAVSVVLLLQTRLGYTDDTGRARARSVTVTATAGAQTVSRTYSGSSYDVAQHELRITFTGPADRQVVSLRRTRAATGDARSADDLRWLALRSESVVPAAYDRGADTLTRVDVRASGQIGTRLDPVHALVGQRVPTWDGDAWTAGREVASNPAAVFRAVALGWRSADGQLLAGAGLDLDEVDSTVLGAWFEWCAAHQPVLECNLVLDAEMDVQRLLELVARCGRASPTWQTGRLAVVWERARAPTAAITPARIVAGTMSVVWAGSPVADEVVMRYVDPDHDWAVRDVRARSPDAAGASASRSVTIDGAGVTSSAQAAYLCSLQAARQSLHRRRLSWEQGPAALALARGDVALLSHALVTGGVTGRARAVTPWTVALDRDVDVPAGSAILLDFPGGSHAQRDVAGVEGSPPVIVFESALDSVPDVDAPGDVAWRLYSADEKPLAVRVAAIEPIEDGRVRVEAMDETPAYRGSVEGSASSITITESGEHVWAGPGSTATVWLVSGRGGPGGRGGLQGPAGPPADGSYHSLRAYGGLGGPGGPGGLDGAGGRRAPAGTPGPRGARGYTLTEYRPAGPGSDDEVVVYTAIGGGGGGGGGGGAGGAGGATSMTLGDAVYTTGVGRGGRGEGGRGGAAGGSAPGRTSEAAVPLGYRGEVDTEVVSLTDLSVGDVLQFSLGAGGGSGGAGGDGGAGAPGGTRPTGAARPAGAADLAIGSRGRAILLPR